MKAFTDSEAGKVITEVAVSAGLSLTIILPVFLFDLLSRIFI